MASRTYITSAVFFPVAWVFIAFVLTQATLAIGVTLDGKSFLWTAAFVLTLLLTATLFRTSSEPGFPISLRAGATAIVLWLLLTALAAIVHDFSWDGQTYHQEAILRLSSGWNPWRHELTVAETDQCDWMNPYPKAMWQVGSLVFPLWGHLEMAKAIPWMVGLTATGMGLLWVQQVAARSKTSLLLKTVGALFALNPVVLSQWATFQVDGVVAWCLAGLFWSLLGLFYPQESPWNSRTTTVLAVIFALLLASTKFTGLVYVAYAVLVTGVIQLRHISQKRQSVPPLPRMIAVSASVLLLSVVCLTNPYYHNVVRHGHPFWPVMGPNPRNVIGYQEHPEFLRQNPLVKFVWANNARSRNIAGFQTPEDSVRYGKPIWKLPFLVYKSEIRPYVAPDVHIGGFGVWYGGILLVSTGVLLVCILRGTPYARWGGLVWFLVWGSVLINPEAWWARYAPQAWWLVLIPVGITAFASRRYQWAGTVLSVLLVVDVLQVTAINGGGQYLCERAFARQFMLLRTASPGSWKPVWGLAKSNRRRFQEAGIGGDSYDTVPSTFHGAYRVKLVRTDTAIETDSAQLAADIRSATPGN